MFPTTYAETHVGLTRQLEEAEKYREFIEQAADRHGFQPCVIAGVGSRESHWGLALRPEEPGGTGDFIKRRSPTRYRQGPLPDDGGGFGRGLMQIDFDAHEFARSGEWKDPERNVDYGGRVLADSRDYMRLKTSVAGRTLLRAALAGYNAGPGNARRAILYGLDIDFYTTGRDYSRDVLNRAGFFQLKGWL
jgi:soluble lytic murein transglycosylase-like protein